MNPNQKQNRQQNHLKWSQKWLNWKQKATHQMHATNLIKMVFWSQFLFIEWKKHIFSLFLMIFVFFFYFSLSVRMKRNGMVDRFLWAFSKKWHRFTFISPSNPVNSVLIPSHCNYIMWFFSIGFLLFFIANSWFQTFVLGDWRSIDKQTEKNVRIPICAIATRRMMESKANK